MDGGWWVVVVVMAMSVCALYVCARACGGGGIPVGKGPPPPPTRAQLHPRRTRLLNESTVGRGAGAQIRTYPHQPGAVPLPHDRDRHWERLGLQPVPNWSQRRSPSQIGHNVGFQGTRSAPDQHGRQAHHITQRVWGEEELVNARDMSNNDGGCRATWVVASTKVQGTWRT